MSWERDKVYKQLSKPGEIDKSHKKAPACLDPAAWGRCYRAGLLLTRQAALQVLSHLVAHGWVFSLCLLPHACSVGLQGPDCRS